jgi:hypothetical protein
MQDMNAGRGGKLRFRRADFCRRNFPTRRPATGAKNGHVKLRYELSMNFPKYASQAARMR